MKRIPLPSSSNLVLGFSPLFFFFFYSGRFIISFHGLYRPFRTAVRRIVALLSNRIPSLPRDCLYAEQLVLREGYNISISSFLPAKALASLQTYKLTIPLLCVCVCVKFKDLMLSKCRILLNPYPLVIRERPRVCVGWRSTAAAGNDMQVTPSGVQKKGRGRWNEAFHQILDSSTEKKSLGDRGNSPNLTEGGGELKHAGFLPPFWLTKTYYNGESC